MKADILSLASDLTARGEPFVLVTVVRREAPSSASVGDTALITSGGTFHGWLGGSCTQPTAIREAMRALEDGSPRLVALSSDPDRDNRPGVVVLPMTCHSGGNVDLYVEPVLPAPRLYLFGASPTSRALSRLAHVLGYAVEAVDELADQASFPEADRVVTNPDTDEFIQRARKHRGRILAVVATLGDNDLEAIRTAASIAPEYLGVVASRKRFAVLKDSLHSSGMSATDLDKIENPAGLNLGATGPEEIALSILAAIIQQGRSVREAKESAECVEELDPVCGMKVSVVGARHIHEENGHSFYFCCGGCRDKFRSDPGSYLPAGEGSSI